MSSTTLSPRAAAITDLTHLGVHWPALRDALTARSANWPPVMGLQHLERDEEQLAEDAAEHAERTADAPGEHPAPLRPAVLDTITAIEDELLPLADEIAGSIQRPAFTARIPAASPNDDISRSLALMAAKDGADPRRWRFNLAERTGETAATWLADRLTDPSGPFRPLSDDQVRRIAAAAAACRHRAEPLLASPTDMEGEPVELDQPCGCGGRLVLTNEPDDWSIQCSSCGTKWTGTTLLASLHAA